MGFISSLFDGVKARMQESAQRKKEDREFQRKIELQAQTEAQLIYRKEYIENARIVAIARAKEDAGKKSGLQKLRALDRVKRLQEGPGDEGSFFSKMRNYTQKNMAKRDENLKRTEFMRTEAEKMKKEGLTRRPTFGVDRSVERRKPFNR